ncbi:hypothetical protein Tco_0875531 [Tanacetum coccineum]|uniref:Uncharacterized protein n=1 Tax=Tanacetum coccineum TaxID=301880 RepID=A0ABQ5BPQ4_9ASTR
MELCTTLQSRVLALESTKTTQANEIAGLKRRVKKLERRNKSRTNKLKRLYKVGLSARVESSRDEESLGKDASKQGRRIIDIDDDEDITLVNDQIDADAKMFNVDTLTGDEVLAEQVVATKDVNLSVDEVTLAQALAALKTKRAKEKRNKPPTQAQQRKIMCTYQKNMEGKKPKDLKNKSFDSIQKMFDRALKRVNTFVNCRTDLVEGSSKREGEELKQDSSKKQKVDDDKETVELKSLMEVIPDEEEVALDAIPLAVKSPCIVDWKIHKEGKKSYY